MIELVEAGEPGADHQYVQLFDCFPIRRLCELRCIHLELPSGRSIRFRNRGGPRSNLCVPQSLLCYHPARSAALNECRSPDLAFITGLCGRSETGRHEPITHLHQSQRALFDARADCSLIWFCLSDLDVRPVLAWSADFSIRLISPCGLWSELGSRWIVVSRDAVERGVDRGPQSPQARNLVKEGV